MDGNHARCIMGNIKVAYTMNRTIFKAQPNLRTDPRLRVTKY